MSFINVLSATRSPHPEREREIIYKKNNSLSKRYTDAQVFYIYESILFLISLKKREKNGLSVVNDWRIVILSLSPAIKNRWTNSGPRIICQSIMTTLNINFSCSDLRRFLKDSTVRSKEKVPELDDFSICDSKVGK